MRRIYDMATGQLIDDPDYIEPPQEVVPQPVPASISRRQCARELFKRQMITGPEMVAMTATGTPPAMIEMIFVAIEDEDEESEARADFAADTYERGNPLLVGIMTASGATPADIDDFFRAAGAR